MELTCYNYLISFFQGDKFINRIEKNTGIVIVQSTSQELVLSSKSVSTSPGLSMSLILLTDHCD